MTFKTGAVFTFVFPSIGMFLHVLAFYLLLKKHANISMNQKIILMNLSLVEILLVCCDLPRLAIEYTTRQDSFASKSLLILFFCILLAYLYIMVALTLDRLAQIYLNIKYDLYWSVKKTKYIMGIIWIKTLLVAVFLLAIVNLRRNLFQHVEPLFAEWITPIAFSLYLFLVVFTYAYIAKKIMQTKRNRVGVSLSRCNESHASRGNNPPHRRKSGVRFKDILMPTLLISTYIFFILPPVFILYLIRKRILPSLSLFPMLINFMFYIGCSADAIICIIFSTEFGKRIVAKK